MSKLKDYKDKIPNWPERKNCQTAKGIGFKQFNQALDFIENLEFNPAELVVLDFDKVKSKIIEALKSMVAYGKKYNLWLHNDELNTITQAIVDNKKDILK